MRRERERAGTRAQVWRARETCGRQLDPPAGCALATRSPTNQHIIASLSLTRHFPSRASVYIYIHTLCTLCPRNYMVDSERGKSCREDAVCRCILSASVRRISHCFESTLARYTYFPTAISKTLLLSRTRRPMDDSPSDIRGSLSWPRVVPHSTRQRAARTGPSLRGVCYSTRTHSTRGR